MIQKDVGEKIKAARKEKQISQQDLSDKTGINRPDISKIEHGKQNLSLSTIQRLADALDKKVIIELRD